MSLTKEVKEEIVQKHGRARRTPGRRRCRSRFSRSASTNSPSTCAATRRTLLPPGLLKLVGRRRRFLKYLQREDLEAYRALIKELGLRR